MANCGTSRRHPNYAADQSTIEAAIATYRGAIDLLDDARMVGAPPDCVAERQADLRAARVRLIELGIDPESSDLTIA